MANHHTRQIPEPSDEQLQELRRWVRRPKTSQALSLRARIILETMTGKSDLEVAEELGTTRATVSKWRRRFLLDGCDGLLDEPRPGAPRKIGDDAVERVVVKTLESLPRDATHWSARSMPKECGLSAATVSRIWRAFCLKPHRYETFKLSRDPLFIENVRDYRRPVPASTGAGGGVVRRREISDSSPGPHATGTTDASRATGAAYARLPPPRHHVAIRGSERGHRAVVGKCYRRHRAVEFRKFPNVIAKEVPKEFDVHLVLDNYGTHKTAIS